MKRFHLLLLAFSALVGAPCEAQTLRVKLVNGRNGKDVGNTGINVWVGNERKDAVPVSINGEGVGELKLTSPEATTRVEAGSVHPTFPYAPQIRLQVGFALCQNVRQRYSWLQITPYSTNEWMRSGIVTANTCGTATARPEPGTLTIFVRPLTPWEKLNE